MEIKVAPCTSNEELKGALSAIWHYFGIPLTPENLERWSRLLGPGRMHAAWEGDAIVGGAGAYAFELSVPGGTVPAAGVTVVGVQPTHRRRGILTAMMRAQLDEVHRQGVAVAYLWASEETIYGRFGYGLASLCGEIDLPKSATAFARPFVSRAEKRLLSEAEAYEPCNRVYERIRRQTPGMLARSEDWWRIRRLPEVSPHQTGGGPLNRLLVTLDGEPAGYALYRINQSMESGVSSGYLGVVEAVGATLEATKEVWRYLFDVDWTARIKAGFLPVDHPLFFILARPRLMKFQVADALWVRLVDVPKALQSRRLGQGEPVVLEVADSFCPWNAGRYRVGGGKVERTEAAADLSLEVNALGSVYLGGFAFGELARAGVVRELKAGAAARADALFPRERAPWCPEIF